MTAKNGRVGSNPGTGRARNLLSNFRTANEQVDMEGALNSLSIDSDTEKRSIQAGPLALDKDSLQINGTDAHIMDLFKLACIQYKPGNVNYRANKMTRKKLLSMRKTLIDKCEEVINQNVWPHG